MNYLLENLEIIQKSINKLKKENEKLKKDLEILEILKERLTIETDYYESDDCCETYEYIAYNGEPIKIESKEEFDLLKEWLEQ